MSTGKEESQQDLDFRQIVNLLDTVLTSDDQRIKDQLRALLTMTILITGENPANMIRVGPLNDLYNTVNRLSNRIGQIEEQVRMIGNNRNYPNMPYGPPGYPTTGYPSGPWIGTDPKGHPTTWGSNWSAGDDPNYKGASSLTKEQIDAILGTK